MKDNLSLHEVIITKRNNLTLFRLVAALLVIYGHASAFYIKTDLSDPILRLTEFDYTGSFGVKFFFLVSGLLVTQSYLKDPDAFRFFARRCARIFPGLITCVFFTALVVGPGVSEIGIYEYFSSKETWTYIANNASLLNLQWELPGVFQSAQTPVVNGSLWSLPIEIICYVCLVVWFGSVYRLSNQLAIFLCFSFVVSYSLLLNSVSILQRYEVILELAACFSIGILFSLYARNVVLSQWGTVIAVFIGALAWNTFLKEPVFYAVLFYVCLYVSSRSFFVNNLNPSHDPSYGIYIYGFVIQQLVAHFIPVQSAMLNFFISSIIALGVGCVSWLLVEQPAMHWAAKRISRRD